ncbi:Cyclopropane-fatty-acyl-phospholipid synthase [Paraurantiacibacter namhicola]|uniref:Cyclopropane-fatty-acyl-phospholipid synthase n=1 Tax=Paraurantiacibacter namhicola TaxID=645517 RepID=A0A1C7D955_9SPHN|nr:Cyclopropane-fatty-acyl-phospholipid synthase [Paraurantiacibacter namhicola]
MQGGARFAAPGIFARLAAPGFEKILDAIDRGLERGTIHGTLPDGTPHTLGGRAPGFETDFALHDWRALVRIATGGSVGLYQAWEAGEWSSSRIVELCALFMDNAETLGNVARAKGPGRWIAKAAHWFNRNTKAGSQKNIHAHYDLGNAFYAPWLDPAMVYSSAMFTGRTGDLAEAQTAKIGAMLDRSGVGQGQRLLEFGCGWGALAMAAADRGAHVDAISLSDEQLAICRERSAGMDGIDFRKQDYRDVRGQYDAIASVEMVEALGREYWPGFMDCIARNLKPGGRAAIQYISIRDELFEDYAASADFIQAYIFPGGMLIRTSEFRALAEKRGLAWTEQMDFGLDYAETLKVWRENFDAALSDGRLPESFDKRFRDLWRFYLQYCEGGFRAGGIDVHQVTLVKE